MKTKYKDDDIVKCLLDVCEEDEGFIERAITQSYHIGVLNGSGEKAIEAFKYFVMQSKNKSKDILDKDGCLNLKLIPIKEAK